MFAELDFMRDSIITVAVVVLVIVLFLLVYLVFSRYTKVGPNQAFVSGLKHREPDGTKVGFRVVKGGGTFVIPVFERWTFFRSNC